MKTKIYVNTLAKILLSIMLRCSILTSECAIDDELSSLTS